MRRRLLVAGAVTGLSLFAAPSYASVPTCSDELGIDAHGQHVVGDYVMGTGHGGPWPPVGVGDTIAGTGAAVPGGPGPGFHFPNGFAPGASFCNDQANSPGAHF